MDILILGNGFDIAHGLNTKYTDFLNYCKNEDKYKHFCTTNIWMKHFLTRQSELGDTWIDLETEIYEVIKFIQTLALIAQKNSKKVDEYIFRVPKNFSDFSLFNIKNFLRKPEYGDVYSKEGTTKDDNVYYHIENYIDLVELLHKHLRIFTKGFEMYLNQETLSTDIKKYKFNLGTDCISLLNFNYTNTCENLYKIKFNHCGCGIKTQSVYIHGKLGNDPNFCNLVFGTHSFFNYLPNDLNEEIPVEFNVFKKHNQRHRYQTIESYQALLNELKYPKKIYTVTFHVVGHSLDKTDHHILKHIFLAKEKSIINIYYHDEDSRERLINNITKIIGEEEVLAKVRMIYQHDPSRGILIPIEDK